MRSSMGEGKGEGEAVPGYILAGGRSRRFGSDKARAAVDGEPLIVRVARMLGPAVCATTVVAQREGQYADLGLRTIGDHEPGRGPLGGLHTAMLDAKAAGGAWLVLVSCDMLVLEPGWVEQLLAARSPEVDAIAFAGDDWQPMPGLYRAHLHTLARDRLSRGTPGGGSLRGFLDAVRSRRLPVPPDWPTVFQANTPLDLERSQRRGRG